MFIVVQVLLGLVYANFVEWFLHKYALHKLGAKKGSVLSFHWHRHHKLSRKNNFVDPDYQSWTWENNGKEVAGLATMTVAHFPLLWIMPAVFAALVFHVVVYYLVHRKSHLDPAWAQRWLPWHYRHHMGDQQKDFNVTYPLADFVMRTRG